MNYDKFGHCVSCHKLLLVNRIIDGEVRRVFSPEKDRIIFSLNDGSRMGVVICKRCKESLTESDYPEIMKSVIKGWEKEMDLLKHWSKEKKKKHMDKYKLKQIVKKEK